MSPTTNQKQGNDTRSTSKDSHRPTGSDLGLQLSAWGTLLLTSLNGVVGNVIHQQNASRTTPSAGLSGNLVSPLDPETPGQIAKISYRQEPNKVEPPTAAPTESLTVSLKDDRSQNRQAYAPNFHAEKLTPEQLQQIAQALSEVEKRVRAKDVEITGIKITGLASPEGRDARSVVPGSVDQANEDLAMQRARIALDQGVEPALLRMGVSPELIQERTTLSATEVQFSKQQYDALYNLARKHGFDGGLRHDVVYRLLGAANRGKLTGLNQAEKQLLESVLDASRGAVITVTLREKPNVPLVTPSPGAQESSPISHSFLIPAIIPWFRRRREADQKDGGGSGTPGKLPPNPPPTIREKLTVPPHIIPLPEVPKREPSVVQIDVLYDLLVHTDAHPEVDYRRMLEESKRAHTQPDEDDLTKRILDSWSRSDETDYSSSKRQEAYARAHARILLTLDGREPQDSDILSKLRDYADSVSPGFSDQIDNKCGRGRKIPSEAMTRVVVSTIERERALYDEVINTVKADTIGNHQQSDLAIKRTLEGRLLQLWSRLDGVEYYGIPKQRRWAALYADELYRRGWGKSGGES